MKSTEIDILVNGQYYLYLPADGIDLVLVRNEYNLLTNDIASMRPMYITQQFEIPLDKNIDIFKMLKNKEKTFELQYNRITIMIGSLKDYSMDEQKRVMLVSISSKFKDVIDFLGNNILYLDFISLKRYNMYVPDNWTTADNNDIVKWAYYNPMNTETGQLVKSDSNIRQYCKPSFHILNFFRECFKMIGWTFNESKLPESWNNLVLAPTTKYLVTSFVFDASNIGVFTIDPNRPEPISTTNVIRRKVNVTISGQPSVVWGEGSNKYIRLVAPNRLQYFKIQGRIKSDVPLYVRLMEKGVTTPLIEWQYLDIGNFESFSQISDSVNTKEGLNPIYLEIAAVADDFVKAEGTELMLYNLIPIYETNQDSLLDPAGYYFSVSDNIPKIVPLELYRELLVLFQISQKSDDTIQNVDYYYINDVLKKIDVVDTNKFVFWNGYESLGDSIEGLARSNIIRYKNDKNRQKTFQIKLPQLPSNNTYFESMFSHGENNNAWKALTVPALNYKVKMVNNISVEYLDWQDINVMLANYVEDDSAIGAHLTFDGLTINDLTSKYWTDIISFMSSSELQTPAVFKLKMRMNYYEYINNFGQNNLFLYKNNAVMIRGQYNVLDKELEATFISVQ